MTHASLASLKAGDQLGNLEYLIDQRVLDRYRVLVGSGGHYPNLLADDCRALLVQRCGPLRLTTSSRSLEFMRPPVLGRRVQVGGWLREIGGTHDSPRLRVAAFAVDEIGTEIMRSEAVFLVGECPQGDAEGGVGPPTTGANNPSVSPYEHSRLADINVGDTLDLSVGALPEGDALNVSKDLGNSLAGFDFHGQGHDFTPLIGGRLEVGIGGWFGEDFRWGGRMSLRVRCPMNSGDTISCEAFVIGRETVDGTGVWKLGITAANGQHQPAVVGETTIMTPSPRRL